MKTLQRLTFWRKLAGLDWLLLLLVIALTVFGVMCIFSATRIAESAALRSSANRQALVASAGLFAALVLAFIDYERWLRLAWGFLGLGIALLLATLVLGHEENNAQSWIRIPGIPFTVQPTEFAKLCYILFLAWFMGRWGRKLPSFMVLCACCGFMGLFIALILAQNDLGSSMVFVPITFFMMFVGGVRKRWLGLAALLGVIGAVLAFFFVLKDYQVTRLTIWRHPEKDPLGAGFHTFQSKIAIGSGGLTGKGFLEGNRNLLGFMPRGTAHSDFVFAGIGEEFGFRGGALLIGALTLVLLLGLKTAARARDPAGMLIATGIVAMLFAHMMENIAMTIGAAPVTGIPLPFVSYGGSFLLTCFLAVGLLLSIHVHRRASNDWEPRR